MKILNAGTRLLTNNEVLQHIEGLREKYKEEGREKSIPNNLKDMLKNVAEILTLDPQTGQRTRTPISNTQIAKIASILAKEPYKLLSTEIAGVVNQVPRTTIDLGLIVEEAEERFSEEQLEEMVGLFGKYLVVETPVVNLAPVVDVVNVVNVAPVAPMMNVAPVAPMLPVSRGEGK